VESTISWPVPTLADVLKARQSIGPYLRATPLLEPAELSAALGCRVVLKCENLNPTGAFKVRGGITLLATLSLEERCRGVVAASTGNHGQSIAYAARLFDCRGVVFMPEFANSLKVASTKSLGAEVVLSGRDFDTARVIAEEYAACHGMRFVHSSNEPHLVAGVGTVALEMFEAAPDLDVVFVPVGAGSGVLGAGVVARALNPAVKVIGVQSEGAPAVYQSWCEGRRIVTENANTFAEGLATREPFEMPLDLFPRFVDEIMLVSDDQIAEGIRLLIKTTRQLAEGAGAATTAAAMARRNELTGKNVGLILSGGNITIEQLSRILNYQSP
jgi:threonine dehydratase